MGKPQRLGNILLNQYLPDNLKFDGEINKKKLNEVLVEFAKQDPISYAKNISSIKRVGDKFATLEGLSVTLKDVTPDYENRDPIINKRYGEWKKAKTDEDKVSILMQTQKEIMDLSKTHKGNLGLQAHSGGRGNFAQLAKSVLSPIVASDVKGNPQSYFIKRSYSEGLSPAEAYITGAEAREAVIKGKTSVAEPGDVGKMLTSVMNRQVIASHDCGTKNGVPYDIDDATVLDRYLARNVGQYKHNDLITHKVIADLRKQGVDSVIVRSPMTCELREGVCQRCQGKDINGMEHEMGGGVGVRASEAMAEPLTQMALSSKHAAGTVKGQAELSGLSGLRQMIDIPEKFKNKAVVSNSRGKITRVEDAPQGGKFIFQDENKHYVSPHYKILVKEGDDIDEGDVLTSGVPDPRDIVKYKGMGEGRRYIVKTLGKLYGETGGIDKRHLEHLAKQNMNFFKVNDHDALDFGLYRGDIVNGEQLKDALINNETDNVSVSYSKGKQLANNYLHHMAGTKINDAMIKDFKKNNIDKVLVAKKELNVEPHLTPIIQTPLFNPDWGARLGHKYIARNIIDAADQAQSMNIHRYDPIPAFIYGSELRDTSESGEY